MRDPVSTTSPLWEEKTKLSGLTTLHDRMLIEAESFVQHFWIDVVKHDRETLRQMKPNAYALWILRPTGSYLCPLYSHVEQWHPSNKDLVTLVEYVLLKIKHEKQQGIHNEYRFYLVRKGIAAIDGSIVSITADDVFSLVFDKLGNFK